MDTIIGVASALRGTHWALWASVSVLVAFLAVTYLKSPGRLSRRRKRLVWAALTLVLLLLKGVAASVSSSTPTPPLTSTKDHEPRAKVVLARPRPTTCAPLSIDTVNGVTASDGIRVLPAITVRGAIPAGGEAHLWVGRDGVWKELETLLVSDHFQVSTTLAAGEHELLAATCPERPGGHGVRVVVSQPRLAALTHHSDNGRVQLGATLEDAPAECSLCVYGTHDGKRWVRLFAKRVEPGSWTEQFAARPAYETPAWLKAELFLAQHGCSSQRPARPPDAAFELRPEPYRLSILKVSKGTNPGKVRVKVKALGLLPNEKLWLLACRAPETPCAAFPVVREEPHHWEGEVTLPSGAYDIYAVASANGVQHPTERASRPRRVQL